MYTYMPLCILNYFYCGCYLLYVGGKDLDGSVKTVKFNEGESEVSSCITLYDDQLLEGDEVFSVLLNIPDVTKREPGLIILSTVTIKGMHIIMCTYICMNVCTVLCVRIMYSIYHIIFGKLLESFSN